MMNNYQNNIATDDCPGVHGVKLVKVADQHGIKTSPYQRQAVNRLRRMEVMRDTISKAVHVGDDQLVATSLHTFMQLFDKALLDLQFDKILRLSKAKRAFMSRKEALSELKRERLEHNQSLVNVAKSQQRFISMLIRGQFPSKMTKALHDIEPLTHDSMYREFVKANQLNVIRPPKFKIKETEELEKKTAEQKKINANKKYLKSKGKSQS